MKLSVVLAAYNGEAFIAAQIDSILGQLEPDDELVVSCNPSTDRTWDIVHAITDRRLIALQCAQKGIVRNFENGLWHATGDLIALSDQDDVWLEGRVARMKSELLTHDLIMLDCKVVDADLVTRHESMLAMVGARPGFLRNVLRNTYTGCCMAFNRKILDVALPMPSEVPMHDWWIGLLGELSGRVKIINQPYSLYRRHSANFSSATEKSRFGLGKKLRNRSFMLFCTTRRHFARKLDLVGWRPRVSVDRDR